MWGGSGSVVLVLTCTCLGGSDFGPHVCLYLDSVWRVGSRREARRVSRVRAPSRDGGCSVAAMGFHEACLVFRHRLHA